MTTAAEGHGLRLNLGCGEHHRPGCINVDRHAGCQPDCLHDLESLPWPWPDDSVQEVHLVHVLEHLGAGSDHYLAIVSELWRVCRDGALVHVVVPHPRHDSFLNDPTHVRVVTLDGLLMFSQQANADWAAMQAPNTPLARMLGIDFEVLHSEYELDAYWKEMLRAGRVDQAALMDIARGQNNVFSSIAATLRAVKPAGHRVRQHRETGQP